MDRWNYGIDENSKLKNALINQLIQGLFVRENEIVYRKQSSELFHCFEEKKLSIFNNTNFMYVYSCQLYRCSCVFLEVVKKEALKIT